MTLLKSHLHEHEFLRSLSYTFSYSTMVDPTRQTRHQNLYVRCVRMQTISPRIDNSYSIHKRALQYESLASEEIDTNVYIEV